METPDLCLKLLLSERMLSSGQAFVHSNEEGTVDIDSHHSGTVHRREIKILCERVNRSVCHNIQQEASLVIIVGAEELR